MALEVSNAPHANVDSLTEDQIWLAILDGRMHREPLGAPVERCQQYRSWGYTFDKRNPKNSRALFVALLYTETPTGDWFVHLVRRATAEEELDYG